MPSLRVPPPDPEPQTFAPGLGEGGFEPYLRAVRRHPLIVILIAVASVAGAGAEMGLRPHRYQAVAQVLVTPVPFAQANYAGLPIIRDEPSDPARATQTAATMLDSPNAAAATARAIGDHWTEGSVQADITVQPIGGTNVLAVQAEAANACAGGANRQHVRQREPRPAPASSAR